MYACPFKLHNANLHTSISLPCSLLGVFLVNVIVHMYLLIGGVGVHWYCIRSKTGAGIDCSRVLPAKYSICSSIIVGVTGADHSRKISMRQDVLIRRSSSVVYKRKIPGGLSGR